MITLLSGMNKARKALIKEGINHFQEETVCRYEKRYQELLEQGRKENKKTKYKYAKQDEAALINRMEKYSHNHLLFLHDFEVPFENNISERDLRKVKNRSQIRFSLSPAPGYAFPDKTICLPSRYVPVVLDIFIICSIKKLCCRFWFILSFSTIDARNFSLLEVSAPEKVSSSFTF